MASDNTLKAFVPNDEGKAKHIRINWSGLNENNQMYSGALSDCMNISSDFDYRLNTSPVSEDFSYVKFSENTKKEDVATGVMPYTILGILGFENWIISLNTNYFIESNGRTSYNIYLKMFKKDNFEENYYEYYFYTGDYYNPYLSYLSVPDESLYQYAALNEILKFSLSDARFFDGKNNSVIFALEKVLYKFVFMKKTGEQRFINAIPDDTSITQIGGGEIKERTWRNFITTNLGRLFAGGMHFAGASSYMNCADWETDISYMTNKKDGYGASHAWISTLQSNDYKGGNITGITSYNGRVIVFKRNFMFEIINNRNPFRINEISAVGTIDSRSVQIAGNILFFASDSGIYAYSGGYPEKISDGLDIKEITSVVSGSDTRRYYAAISGKKFDGKEFKNTMYVFDTSTNAWTKRKINPIISDNNAIECEVVNFTTNNNGLYYLLRESLSAEQYNKKYNAIIEDGGGIINIKSVIRRVDTEEYKGNDWFADTEIYMNGDGGSPSLNPKRLKQIKFLCDLAPESEIKISSLSSKDRYASERVMKTYKNNGQSEKRINVRLNVTMRSDYGLKLKLSGCGLCKVYEMEIFYTDGGDVNATERT